MTLTARRTGPGYIAEIGGVDLARPPGRHRTLHRINTTGTAPVRGHPMVSGSSPLAVPAALAFLIWAGGRGRAGANPSERKLQKTPPAGGVS